MTKRCQALRQYRRSFTSSNNIHNHRNGDIKVRVSLQVEIGVRHNNWINHIRKNNKWGINIRMQTRKKSKDKDNPRK